MNYSSWLDEFRQTKSRESRKETFLSLSLYAPKKSGNRRSLSQLRYFPFYTLDTWITSRHVSPFAQVRFCPETIYFISVQVQIILYQLSLNYFTTSKMFFKNLVFGVHRTLVTSKNVKIPTISHYKKITVL